MTKQDAITMLSERLKQAEGELMQLRRREWDAMKGRDAVHIALATIKSKEQVPFLATTTGGRQFFVVKIEGLSDENVQYRAFLITRKGKLSKEPRYLNSEHIAKYESIYVNWLYEFIEKHMPKMQR